MSDKKYIVIKTEVFTAFNERCPSTPQELARLILKHPEAILENEEGHEDEHFVLMVRDIHARPALVEYARSAWRSGAEKYAQFVSRMAERAGNLSKYAKLPD